MRAEYVNLGIPVRINDFDIVNTLERMLELPYSGAISRFSGRYFIWIKIFLVSSFLFPQVVIVVAKFWCELLLLFVLCSGFVDMW